jgi:replicative DNA helicase
VSADIIPLTANDIGFNALSRPLPEATASLLGKNVTDVTGPTTIYAAVAAFQQRLERSDADCLPFGLSRIDRATRGIEPGELAILLGRTASLKTMWGLNHLRLLVKRRPDSAFLIVEMEMPREQLIRRLLRMDYNRSDDLLDDAIKSGTISLDRFCETYRHLYFVDQGAISLSAVARYTDDLQRQLGDTPLEGIFLDHAGLLRPEHSASAYERASATAIGLKQLARTQKVAVFCIVQANRAGNNKDGEPVNLEAARDSGCYEENADFVLAFSSMTDPPGAQPFVKLRLAKNRRGPNVPTTVGFDPLSLKMAERDETRDGE